MQRGEHDVEAGEQVVLEVERSVVHDVDLDPVQDLDAAVTLTQKLHFRALVGDLLRRQLARRPCPLRVIGDGDVLVSQLSRREHHVLDRVAAVAPRAVHVEIAADVPVGDEARQRALFGGRDLVGSFTKLRGNEREVQDPVELVLACARDGDAVFRQRAVGQRQAQPLCLFLQVLRRAPATPCATRGRFRRAPATVSRSLTRPRSVCTVIDRGSRPLTAETPGSLAKPSSRRR